MAVKARRGGKYPLVSESYPGYYGNDIAGTEREASSKEAGTRRSIGRGTTAFTFYSKEHGYLTIRASSFEEAWRLAKIRGYSRRNYERGKN